MAGSLQEVGALATGDKGASSYCGSLHRCACIKRIRNRLVVWCRSLAGLSAAHAPGGDVAAFGTDLEKASLAWRRLASLVPGGWHSSQILTNQAQVVVWPLIVGARYAAHSRDGEVVA